jgi:hypothetical protein
MLPENLQTFVNPNFYGTFRHLPSLKTLILPESVYDIACWAAFSICTFDDFYAHPTIAPLTNSSSFEGSTGLKLHIPIGATGYDVAPWTTVFSSIIADL